MVWCSRFHKIDTLYIAYRLSSKCPVKDKIYNVRRIIPLNTVIKHFRTLTREFNKSFPTEKKSPHSASPFSLYQVGPQERTLTINNLRPFTVYGVTVRALNQVRLMMRLVIVTLVMTLHYSQDSQVCP